MRLNLPLLGRKKRPTAADGTPMRKYSLPEYYAAYLFKKHPLQVSKGEVEVAKRELIRLSLEALARFSTREEAVEWIVGQLSDFYEEFPSASRMWKTFSRLLGDVTEEDLRQLPDETREALIDAYLQRGGKFPVRLRVLIESVFGVDRSSKLSSSGKRPLWEYYAMAVEGVDDLEKIPPGRREELRREFRRKVARCWFLNLRRMTREACFRRELGVLFERFPGISLNYFTLRALVHSMSAEEIAEYVPPDKLRLFLRSSKSHSLEFLEKVHRAMVLSAKLRGTLVEED